MNILSGLGISFDLKYFYHLANVVLGKYKVCPIETGQRLKDKKHAEHIWSTKIASEIGYYVILWFYYNGGGVLTICKCCTPNVNSEDYSPEGIIIIMSIVACHWMIISQGCRLSEIIISEGD